MTYDTTSNLFNLYTESTDLIGKRTYSLLAKFQKYPMTASDVQTGTITVMDPCASPNHIVATEQSNPPAYYYTGQPLKFVMNPFETWPDICGFTYECVSVQGPDPFSESDL